MASSKAIGCIPVGAGPTQLYATPDGTRISVVDQGTDPTPGNVFRRSIWPVVP